MLGLGGGIIIVPALIYLFKTLEMNEQQLGLRRELSSETNTIRQSQSETSAATKIATTAMQQAKSAANNPQER